MSPCACNHEKADMWVTFHLVDVTSKGFKNILICTFNPDVVGLAVSAMTHIVIEEHWLGFGDGIKLHEIARSLGVGGGAWCKQI
jgi:hypothetical protein